MGRLVEGKWHNETVNPNESAGEYRRSDSIFKDSISIDNLKLKPEKGRYHQYLNC